MVNKKNILQQCESTQPGRLKTKYGKMESVLLEWFRQKLALYIPEIQGPVLRQEAEEVALKLNISHLLMDGLINSKKQAVLNYRTMSVESKSVVVPGRQECFHYF
jgi:hypothetical protein